MSLAVRYVELLKMKNDIEKEIKKIKEILPKEPGVYEGVLVVSEVPIYKFDVEKIYKVLGRQIFLENATITKDALVKCNLSEKQINKLIKEVKISLRYATYNKEKEEKYSKKESE